MPSTHTSFSYKLLDNVIGARPGIGVRSGNRGSPGNRGRSGNKGSPPGIEVRHRKLRNDGY